MVAREPLLRGLAEHVGKHGGLADVHPLGGCQEDDRPHLRHLAEVFDGSGLCGLPEIRAVAAGELVEALRIVAVPSAQFGAGGDVLSPLVQVRIFFPNPARPFDPRAPERGLRRKGRTPGRLLSAAGPLTSLPPSLDLVTEVRLMSRDLGPTTMGRR